MRDGTQQPKPSALNGTAPARPALRRTIQAPPIGGVRLATGSAASFAESILARYAGRSGRRLRPNLIYHRPGPGWIIQRVLQRSSPVLSLRLALNFTQRPGIPSRQTTSVRDNSPAGRAARFPLILESSGMVPASVDAVHAPIRPTMLLTSQAASTASPMRLPRTRSAPMEAAYRRGAARQAHEARPPVSAVPLALSFDLGMTRPMTARGQRLSMVQPSGRAAPASPAPRPVPRVVHRPQAAPQPAQAGQRAAQFGGDDAASGEFPAGLARTGSPYTGGWPGTDTSSTAPDGLAPHQVQRLADQVVQIIDDRIIARRERVGRV